MKTILIIGAMEEEILPLVESGNYEKRDEKPFPYYIGNDGERQLIITVSKVGLVAMSACTQHFITLVERDTSFADHSIDLVINMGVAGAISSELEQGDIVVADKLCQHDMDVTGLGYEIGLNPDYKSVFFEADTAVVNSVRQAYDEIKSASGGANYNLITGTIASGDQFISSKEKKEFIESTFAPAACEMEGAALAQVCSDNDIPFLIVRAISDKADGEAPLSYVDFKANAITNLTALIQKVVKKY